MRITGNLPGKGYAEIEIHKGSIASVSTKGEPRSDRPFISPGLIDIQINGFAGVDFSDPHLEPEQVCGVLPALWKTGVVSFCPTLITNSHHALVRNFRVLAATRAADPQFRAAVPCYHLEGPFLSPGESRGVHSPSLMRPPSWEEFSTLQEAAGGRIGLLTLAPELPGALDLIQRASQSGVIVAIGHSDANADQIRAAVQAGARLSTHLGNGCPQFIHRHQAPIWSQLVSDELSASLICDTFHLPPEVVQVIVRCKGLGRCILVTDAVHLAQMGPGRYLLAGTEVELLPEGQVVKTGDWCLAGSTVSMNRAIRVFMDYTALPLREALLPATTNPGFLLRRPGICVALVVGQPANLVLFQPDSGCLYIESVILAGKEVYIRDQQTSQSERIGAGFQRA